MYTTCGCSGYGQERGEPLKVEGFIDLIFASIEHAERFRMESIRNMQENGIIVGVSTIQETPEGFIVYFSLTGPPETAQYMPELVSPLEGEILVEEKKSVLPVILAIGGAVGLIGLFIAISK